MQCRKLLCKRQMWNERKNIKMKSIAVVMLRLDKLEQNRIPNIPLQ